MAVKTDRNDARAIAHAMRVGWFTTVACQNGGELSNRRTLLEKRVAIDNEIRGTLKAFGLRLGPVTVAGFDPRNPEAWGLWGLRCIASSRAFALPSNTRGRSRMRETRSSGSVRGASGDGRPYRERRPASEPAIPIGRELPRSCR
jgi:hypothetical protein